MKNKAKLFWQYSAIFLLLGGFIPIFAHDVPVHRQITLNAAESAVELSDNYNGFIATIGGTSNPALAKTR